MTFLGPVLALFLLLVAPPASAATSRASDAVFRQLIEQRVAAYASGDVAAYERLLDREFVHISDRGQRRTRKDMSAFVGQNAGGSGATYVVTALAWRVDGDVATVDAALSEHSGDFDGGFRETDIFVWRNGRWLYGHHQETAVLQTPRAVAIADDVLSDYAGRYRSVTGAVDIITVQNGALRAQPTPNDPGVALIPVARGAFAIPQDPTVVVFLRDAKGAVVGCLWHLPSGQAISSTRVD